MSVSVVGSVTVSAAAVPHAEQLKDLVLMAPERIKGPA
jgi:hypothetical protein